MKKGCAGVSAEPHCRTRSKKDGSDRHHDLYQRHKQHHKAHAPDIASIATGYSLIDDVRIQGWQI